MSNTIRNSVCCVIVTYNIGKNFYKCFNAINGQTEKIVIVDNGSDEETLKVLKELNKFDHVELILNKENMGIAYALNEGVKYAVENGLKWILTMDNDSMATANMVDKLLQVYEKLPSNEKDRVVSLFPSYVEESTLESCELKSNEHIDSLTYKFIIAEITSGNLVKADIFSRTGYFIDEFFIDYVDIEFCLRLHSMNYKLLQVNEVFLIHNLGKTEKAQILSKSASFTNHSPLRRYYITRNRIVVWKRYFSSHTSFILKDVYACFSEMAKIFLFEEQKKEKLSMFFRGLKDAVLGNYGKLT